MRDRRHTPFRRSWRFGVQNVTEAREVRQSGQHLIHLQPDLPHQVVEMGRVANFGEIERVGGFDADRCAWRNGKIDGQTHPAPGELHGYRVESRA